MNLFYYTFLDPNIKAQIRKYLAQTSNAYHHSEIPNLDSSDIQLSDSSHHNISSHTKISKLINPSTSSKSLVSNHRTTSSDPTYRPSRIPQAIKSPTHQPAAINISKSAPQSPHSGKSKTISSQIPTSNGSSNNNTCNSGFKEPSKARFEAYMMTGDLILNLSRTPQSSGLIPTQNRKVS